jgi:CO/xanthine dehydrogenase FAD-binding subunit
VSDTRGVLASRSSTAEAKTAALRELVEQASPISDVRGGRDYRLAMLDVMSRRALESAMQRLEAK